MKTALKKENFDLHYRKEDSYCYRSNKEEREYFRDYMQKDYKMEEQKCKDSFAPTVCTERFEVELLSLLEMERSFGYLPRHDQYEVGGEYGYSSWGYVYLPDDIDPREPDKPISEEVLSQKLLKIIDKTNYSCTDSSYYYPDFRELFWMEFRDENAQELSNYEKFELYAKGRILIQTHDKNCECGCDGNAKHYSREDAGENYYLYADILDVALSFHICLDVHTAQFLMVQVTKELIQQWGITEEEFLEFAVSEQNRDLCLRDCTTYKGDYMFDSDCDVSSCLLSLYHEDQAYQALYFNEAVLDRIAARVGGDFLIFPVTQFNSVVKKCTEFTTEEIAFIKDYLPLHPTRNDLCYEQAEERTIYRYHADEKVLEAVSRIDMSKYGDAVAD